MPVCRTQCPKDLAAPVGSIASSHGLGLGDANESGAGSGDEGEEEEEAAASSVASVVGRLDGSSTPRASSQRAGGMAHLSAGPPSSSSACAPTLPKASPHAGRVEPTLVEVKRLTSTLRKVSHDSSSGLGRMRTSASSGSVAPEPSFGDLKMHGMAFEDPWPNVQLFKALQRSRNSLNLSARCLGNVTWFIDTKPLTITAFERRFRKHTAELTLQGNLDVQVAHKQIHARAKAVIVLHTALRNWLTSPQHRAIVNILQPLDFLSEFLVKSNVPLAPNTAILQLYGLFYETFEKTGKTSAALHNLSRPVLEKLVAWYLDVVDKPPPFKRPPTKKQAVKRQPSEGDDDDDGDGNTKKDGPPTKQYVPVPLTTRMNFGMGACRHAAAVTCECMKLYFHALPTDICQSNDALNEVISEMQLLSQLFSSRWVSPPAGEEQDPDAEAFSKALEAMCIPFQCALHDEKMRPPASLVRHARKVINDAIRAEGAFAELAKATLAYDVLRVVLEASRAHSVAGIEDQAATTVFDQASEQFEGLLEVAFSTSLGEWADPPASDAATASSFSLSSRRQELVALRGIMVTIQGAIQRWSPAALQEHLTEVADTLGNILDVIGASSWTLCACFAPELRTPLQAFGISSEVGL